MLRSLAVAAALLTLGGPATSAGEAWSFDFGGRLATRFVAYGTADEVFTEQLPIVAMPRKVLEVVSSPD